MRNYRERVHLLNYEKGILKRVNIYHWRKCGIITVSGRRIAGGRKREHRILCRKRYEHLKVHEKCEYSCGLLIIISVV